MSIWCAEREPNASAKSLEADRSASRSDEASRSVQEARLGERG